MTELFVSEIFSAIQGEGAYVGCRQVFLRLQGCPYRCAYCDQPEALEKRPGPYRYEQTAGRRDFVTASSPVAASQVVEHVDALWRALPHHSVSVTGGEPLMQAGRLAELLPLLAARGHRIYLETSGTLVEGLVRVLPWVAHVSMDIKLASVDGVAIDPEIQRRFLEVAAAADVFVKVVIGPATAEAELDRALRMVVATAPGTVVYLQPVTPAGTVSAGPTPEQMLEHQRRALSVHPDVRVVPQTHVLMGQL